MTAEADLIEAVANIGAGEGYAAADESVSIKLANGEVLKARIATSPAAALRSTLDLPMVVVADRISQADRRSLRDHGIGWLDRRGHLFLATHGVWIDTEVPPLSRLPVMRAVDPLAGPAVSSVTIDALQRFPAPASPVRALAREVGVSASAVSMARRRLVEAGLLTADHRAAKPGLFWTAADSWRPAWVDLAAVPDPSEALVAVGGRAAAVIDAPLAVVGGPVELLTTDQRTLRQLVRRHQTPPGEPAARVAIAPGVAFGRNAGPGEVDGHPTAAPVVIAMSLAGDKARGAEVVERWEIDGRPW